MNEVNIERFTNEHRDDVLNDFNDFLNYEADSEKKQRKIESTNIESFQNLFTVQFKSQAQVRETRSSSQTITMTRIR